MQGKPEPGPCRVSAGRASGRTAGSCGGGRTVGEGGRVPGLRSMCAVRAAGSLEEGR